MNKLFLASAIALASLAATSFPSQAASVVITDDGGNYHHHNYQEHNDWNHRHHRDCFTKTVKEWHHGHKVITEQRVCR